MVIMRFQPLSWALNFKVWNLRKFTIDLLAIFVAAIALIFSILQGKEQINHNHISVEPRINSYFTINGKEDKWGIYVINNGMGTAFVSDLTVLVDGVPVADHEWGKFYSAVISLKLNPLCFIYGGPRPNDSFPVGKEQILIEGNKDNPIAPKTCPIDYLRLQEYQKERLDYQLKIKSIYGDTFEYQFSKNEQVDI